MNEQNMTLIERKSLRQRVSGSVWRKAYRAKRTIARKFRRIEYRMAKRWHRVAIHRTEVVTF